MGEAPDRERTSMNYRDPPPFEVSAQGHELVLLPGGGDRLDALLGMIANARKSLELCFYIYATDRTGVRVRDALVNAAKRGVRVTVTVDDFGADADDKFFADLVAAGGTFVCFIASWGRRYLIRNHQKMVIADGEVAMLGGFNIEDSYFEPAAQHGWQDLAFTVRGPVVEPVSEWFAQLVEWAAHPKAQFRSVRRKIRGWDAGEGAVKLLIGGPTKGLSSWARCVSHDLIEGERLDMIMAYFSPPRRLQNRIRRIARKGSTNLVLAGKTDNAATIGAARALYGRLLKSGARIFEFQPCRLHTKLIVLDDAVYLGSANFDMRSLYLNLEIVLRIEDAALAERMRGYIADHFPASLEVTAALHRRRGTVWNHLRWTLSWFLVAVLDYTVSRRLNLGLPESDDD